jgi:hypothetical protein
MNSNSSNKMIIKCLLFIIICIFVYETFKMLYKMKEEYFESFGNGEEINPDLLDVNKTIYANCKLIEDKKDKLILMSYSPDDDAKSLDGPYSSAFKPLTYNKTRKYFWNSENIIEEGLRRGDDNKKDIDELKVRYDKEEDIDKKHMLGNELALYDWYDYRFKEKNLKGDQRIEQDFITDYYTEEIGLSRPWRERHSHLPNYHRIAQSNI